MKIYRRLAAICAIALTFVQSVAFAGPPRPSPVQLDARPLRVASPAAPSTGRLVVGLRAGSDLLTTSSRLGAKSLEQRWGAGVRATALAGGTSYALDAPASTDLEALRARIAADAGVAYVEPEYHYQARLRPNDRFYDRQYALPRIAAEQGWDITTGNPSVMIAVVDTGIYAEHPDLQPNIVRGADFVNRDADSSDDEGHGTHTAGIIGAVGNNDRGIAGVCWQCKILAVKALDEQGGGSSINVSAGIRYAVDQGARVINLSLGGENDSRLLHDAIIYATARGALVVVAAGNEAEEGNPVEYPAAYSEVIAVGATDGDDARAFFSNYGSYLDVAAPGVSIASALWASGETEVYAYADGTSEAAPFVAGLAGLIWSINPSFTNAQVRELILAHADDVGEPGRDDLYGVGRINVYRSLAAAQALTNPAPQPPSPVPADGILFPETGRVLRGEFRRFWADNGGLPIFGLPITDEQVEQTPEGSFLVQYFERNRFEFHPEQPAPYNVQLGRLGDTLLRTKGIDWYGLPKSSPQPGCQFFAETGHSICEPFLSYWRSHGLQDARLDPFGRSLGLFGLPLTEPRLETNASGASVVTQWFERARFEDHGSGPGGPGVLLGLLASELRATPQAPAPAPPIAGPPVATPCPEIPASQNGQVRPGPCLALGSELILDATGFQPGEEASAWLTGPNNQVLPSDQAFNVAADGSLSVGLSTSILTQGRWFAVFQGRQSGRQAVLYFHLY